MHVTVDCSECGAAVQGEVAIDPGEPETSNGPGVRERFYVASYKRNCTCGVAAAQIERALIIAAAVSLQGAA